MITDPILRRALSGERVYTWVPDGRTPPPSRDAFLAATVGRVLYRSATRSYYRILGPAPNDKVFYERSVRREGPFEPGLPDGREVDDHRWEYA